MTSAANLPPIPAKRYFTIGEVAVLCGVKPHVLRYWEQEFAQLRPMKRRGNRRYYQHHEVLMVRRIRELLYEQGFTISGARAQLQQGASDAGAWTGEPLEQDGSPIVLEASDAAGSNSPIAASSALGSIRQQLLEIRRLLEDGEPETGDSSLKSTI
jgi:DNA-binding transcriptional MerR regulator